MTSPTIDWPDIERSVGDHARLMHIVYAALLAAGFGKSEALTMTVAYQQQFLAPRPAAPESFNLAGLLSGKVPT